MDIKDWENRWVTGQIGFHQEEVNPFLVRYLPDIKLKQGEILFVPLCGKSKDLCWIVDRGYGVIGVEAVSMAIESFFAENELDYTEQVHGSFTLWQSDQILIYCGDYFKLTSADFRGIYTVYDRASLVSFPTQGRRQYAQHLLSLFPEKLSILLVTLSYPQHEMDGPPFSVDEQEVHALFGDRLSVNLLQKQNVLSANQRFQERGLSELWESAYLLSNL